MPVASGLCSFAGLPDPAATDTADRLDQSFDEFVAQQTETLQDLGNLFAGVDYLRYLDGEKHLVFVTPKGLTLPRGEDARAIALAAVGLLLAAVGVAGVTTQNVIRRPHEIGVRLALGARPRRVVGMVVRQILLPVVGGVVAGLAGAWAMAQSLASLLFDITPHDPITFACVAGLLVMVSLVAAWLPARRAATVNPINRLRAE